MIGSGGMVEVEIPKLPENVKKDYIRITCNYCGKLLFKVRSDLVSKNYINYEIEIKCYNARCKKINRILF